MEGAVGLGIAFLLLTLLAQAGLAVVARNAAEGAVAAAARRAARPDAAVASVRGELDRTLAATVPGVAEATSDVGRDAKAAWATASFRWNPPGPAWLPIRIRVAAEVPVLAPP